MTEKNTTELIEWVQDETKLSKLAGFHQKTPLTNTFLIVKASDSSRLENLNLTEN